MSQWTKVDFDDINKEHYTTVGQYRITLNQTGNHPDHWAYTIRHPDNGLYACGNRYPWDLERAKNFAIMFLAMRALSVTLTGDRYRLYSEDSLDRV